METENTFKSPFFCGDPVGIRTRDPQLRRLLLYPAELRNHHVRKNAGAKVRIFLITTKFQTRNLMYARSSNEL